MLPGHPVNSELPNISVSMPPTSQHATIPESAQHQTGHVANEIGDSLAPRTRSNTTPNLEMLQQVNSMLGNTLNLASLTERNNSNIDGMLQNVFGDQDGMRSDRAVGSMRAIRGSGGIPFRVSDSSESSGSSQLQQPQLSDHLKSLISRHGNGGEFGSLISPLPSVSSNTSTISTSTGYPWPPFHVYQGPEVMSSYFGGMNPIDYCTLREPFPWDPLPLPPTPTPPPSTITQTPPTPVGHNATSPEKSSSTGSSSSSGLSISHLTDLMAQLTADSPLPTIPNSQTRQTRNEMNPQSEWSSIYQLRHNGRSMLAPSAPPMQSFPVSTPSPPVAGSSSSSPSTAPCDYTALILAAANYLQNSPPNGGPGQSATVQYDQGSRPINEEPNSPDQHYSIERAARIYRKAATICDATCTWSGQLPANLITRTLQNQSYSCKVFVGGVPWDVTEQALLAAFNPFGPVRVEWPGKEARYARSPVKPSAKGKGYVYMIYETDRSVKALLENCIRDFSHGGEYYFQLTSRRLRAKEIRQVQIIPWNISDSNHIRCSSQRLDPKKTVFVGALHGMITAEVLCNVMNDLFGGVVYAGIDTDKYKYPIGSGRVTFNNTRSYHKAIAAAFVEIKSAKFSKKVQIDPYLEDATCSNCLSAPGPYFCREFMCFRYFCKTCWHNQHALDVMQSHKPLMRNTRRVTQQQSQPVSPVFSHHTAPQF